jgi:hypothetical protein
MPGPTGQRGDIIGNKLNANNPNELTDSGRPKDPVGLNDGSSATNRFVIPLATGTNDANDNQALINKILKALKGSGIIHFKPIQVLL